MGNKKTHFFNRELSWIEFNARVLTEANRKENPLLERLKFLSIVSSNFDEFFMVRVAGLKHQAKINPNEADSSGLTPLKQLTLISERVHEIFSHQHMMLREHIFPLLGKKGLSYIPPEDFTEAERQFAGNFFQKHIFPLLTPLKSGKNGELPYIANLRLYAAFLLKPIIDTKNIHPAFCPAAEEKALAFVQIPPAVQRIIWLPSESKKQRFTLLDDIILAFGTRLFEGYSVDQSLVFKAVCDAAFTVDEERHEDFMEAMEEILAARRASVPIRLTCTDTSSEITKILVEKTGLSSQDVYKAGKIIDLSSLSNLAEKSGFSKHRYPAWKPLYPPSLMQNEAMWDILKQRDILLHVPYESYDPVLRFINDAADDPDVLAIKMTLYRTSGKSPIIKTLERAARKGKQVTVFVELKARFDEKRNISWAQQLMHFGVIVVHGIANLKVHAKMLLVVRRESDGIVRYVHMATGNYNEKTARLYSDISLFTSNPEIANDATVFFNMISGYSAIQTMRRLYMAPVNLKSRLLYMIEREKMHSTRETPGLIMAKMNSLADPDIIKALYDANNAHVRIMLNVRGICTLVPGIRKQSENISVISIVDRFLEHSRIFYFQNGGAEEAYLSSADWMSRNLDRRVELMFPVTQKDLFQELKDILHLYFSDNTHAHELNADGTWSLKKPRSGEIPVRAQESLYNKYKQRAETANKEIPRLFTVRRKEPRERGGPKSL
ncbi:polyphosphate kinase 1 [Treponema sp. OMZ 840]|uniref:polyphosphate kinase 1 n=1 Tax=Treponema sp. OMZ 840 TaxID=244313 RepID=UPI003D938FB7